MATYTYDLNTTVGKLRLACRDNNLWRTGLEDRRSQSCYFSDEELEAFYSMADNDFWLAAA